jgi:hypothetical protein
MIRDIGKLRSISYHFEIRENTCVRILAFASTACDQLFGSEAAHLKQSSSDSSRT